ncbi:hydroxyacid dehydrogenase [Streptomyces viridiviolaceus]
MSRPKAALAMSPDLIGKLFDEARRVRLHNLVDIDTDLVLTEFTTSEASRILAGTEVLITGWGCPAFDVRALEAAPGLRSILHSAGSVRTLFTSEVWRRGVTVSSAADANSIPVAEFTVAAVLFANKRVLPIAAEFSTAREPRDWGAAHPGIGNFAKRVGIVGASRIGRRVVELLRPYDLEVVVSDPYLSAVEAERFGTRLVELDDLCASSDVVSLHAPALPETRHLIDARRLALMSDGATLVNTARGSLVDHASLTREILAGRLFAVLDVTDPEPLPSDSPLYGNPRVLLTPHLAGSLGTEIGRLGDATLEELNRYVSGRPLLHAVAADDLARSA